MTDRLGHLVRVWRFYRRHSPLERGHWRIDGALKRRVADSGYSEPTLVRTRPGFLMELQPDDFVQREIYVTGCWQPALSRLIETRLRPGDGFVDIGANVGYFSLLAGQVVGPSGYVLAFEPNPAVYQRLRLNVGMNAVTNINCHMVGLADKPGKAMLHVPSAGHTGAGSLVDHANTDSIAIELGTLDAFVAKNCRGPRMLKIDVEGAEVLALSGARETLRRFHPDILCEVSEWSLTRLGTSREALYELLNGLGYHDTMVSPYGIGHTEADRQYRQYDALFIWAR